MELDCNRACDKLDVDPRGTGWYATAALSGFVQGSWKGLTTQATIGMEMVLGVILPCYVGSLADKHFQTGRTFVLVGFFFGVAHAVRVVWRAVKQGNKEAERAEQEMKKKRAEYYAKRD